jgi:hypothetical protein
VLGRDPTLGGGLVRKDGKLYIDKQTTAPFWPSIGITFDPPGAYDIRIRRTDAERNNEGTYDQCNWVSLKSLKFTSPLAPRKPRSILEMRIDGTDQLNSIIDEINCIATSELMTWDGVSWSVRLTRPGLCRHPAAPSATGRCRDRARLAGVPAMGGILQPGTGEQRRRAARGCGFVLDASTNVAPRRREKPLFDRDRQLQNDAAPTIRPAQLARLRGLD